MISDQHNQRIDVLDLDSTKGKISQLLIKFLFFYTWPLAIFSWLRILKVGFLPVMTLHGFLLILLTIVYIKRETLKSSTLNYVILTFFHLVGIGGIPTHHLVIYVYPSFIISIVLATFFFDRKFANKVILFQFLISTSGMLGFVDPSKFSQNLFEIIGYTVFEYFLVKAIDMIRVTLLKNIKERDNALKAKSRFLALMSHEIRTPLTGIVLASEQLKSLSIEDEGKELATIIERSSLSLNSIISDILDISKIQNNAFQIENITFDLNQVIHALKQNYDLLAKEKGIEFEVESDLESFAFKGDPVRLEQILRNLLSNAFKFTSRGKVTLKVTPLPKIGDELTYYQFSVEDTGIGIESNRLEKIFDEFEQENLSTTRKYGGTGLGLAIVKNLSHLMGGEVHVESEKGKGTKFLVQIPLERTTLPYKVADLDTFQELIFSKKVHALVVEDNETNAKLISRRLEKLGFHKIEFATNGQDALEILEKEIFDIVFMDVQMPVMDGLTATLKIRKGEAGERNLTIPIVGLSANAFEDDYQKGKEAGMNHYLAKPIKKEKLYFVLQDFITKGLL